MLNLGLAPTVIGISFNNIPSEFFKIDFFTNKFFIYYKLRFNN